MPRKRFRGPKLAVKIEFARLLGKKARRSGSKDGLKETVKQAMTVYRFFKRQAEKG
jgi:hypothetical protein